MIFNLFDPSESGLIKKHQISRVAKATGKELTPQELRRIFNNCSKNGCEIGSDDFLYIMTRPEEEVSRII